MDSKITERAEEVLLKELKINGFNKMAMNFVPLVMVILEESVEEKTPSED